MIVTRQLHEFTIEVPLSLRAFPTTPPIWASISVDRIQLMPLIMFPSPSINTKELEHYKVGDYLSAASRANQHGWPIKSNDLLLVALLKPNP